MILTASYTTIIAPRHPKWDEEEILPPSIEDQEVWDLYSDDATALYGQEPEEGWDTVSSDILYPASEFIRQPHPLTNDFLSRGYTPPDWS